MTTEEIELKIEEIIFVLEFHSDGLVCAIHEYKDLQEKLYISKILDLCRTGQ